MANLIDVEAYLIANGTNVTPKKLQKLLYFSQGWFMALNDDEENSVIKDMLFDDEFQAWKHGPVIPSTYHRYKHFSYSTILSPVSGSANNLCSGVQEFLNEILEEYDQFSGDKLEAISHAQTPWKEAFNGELFTFITKQNIYQFFSKELISN